MRSRAHLSLISTVKARSATMSGPHVVTLESGRQFAVVSLKETQHTFIERETLTFEDGKLQSYEYAEVR